MNYIYINRNSIFLLIIFKDENFSKNWLSKELLEEWHISYNNKDWINNMHDMKWLKKYFESMIWEKINEEFQFLIYNAYFNRVYLSLYC